ncbi:palmitoleoyl-protein carboxylesterase NOTUM-like isoform X2 [Xenia sp. Carnegie-2017]|uniref:palmitoleoyl-protein carboxylesterase NOTUM-like isoform X2 n=1 Tax=Xenia sp. Carnegie-2017 TaxID=2897299 RepID=UPI001F03741A|nr:palmitoleoyl-protein carboxylesterase NOTUM-like isoform X2 [Xenia sp. Carnegie-2017]
MRSVEKTSKKSYFALLVLFLPHLACNPLPSRLFFNQIQRLEYKVNYLANELLKCQQKDHHLHMMRFQNADITCNDGSTAGYYIKRSYQSKNWIIYLEGGWYCFNDASCTKRMNISDIESLMSSKNWPLQRRGSGILSSKASENPSWYDANHVLVPYCSSDVWSGNISKSESGGKFSFMGYRIINEVIRELLMNGLMGAKQLILAGSSVGGIGVIMSIDRVAKMMSTAGSSCKVRGIADSGWYLESKPDLSKCKINPTVCNSPSHGIRMGMSYWNGVLPETCSNMFQHEPWRCYFGHNVYKSLKSPLFIFQWIYDPTQVLVHNPTSMNASLMKGELLINRLMSAALKMKKSVVKNGLSGVFLPACLSHSILTKSDWLMVKVKGYTLDHAVNCWISKEERTNSSLSSISRSTHCKSFLIDNCTLPQCNSRCSAPVIHSPANFSQHQSCPDCL